jgi:hypothetical protein
MKIINRKLNFATGKFEDVESEVKTKNFTKGEATTFFRDFLSKKGLSQHIGTKLVTHPKYGQLQYITLFGRAIEAKFTLWQSRKDSEHGKAVFWIGERNTVGYEKIDHGVIIKGRMVPTHVFWYCLIVAPRHTFKVGTSIKEQEFMEFLLMPLDDIIVELNAINDPCVNIRKSHREKYSFDNMLETLKTKEEVLNV